MARHFRSSQKTLFSQDMTVISPFITGMPHAGEHADNASSPGDITDLYFPSRELCMRYVTTFFEQVHCIYWVYSSEQFFSQLDKTLEAGPRSCGPSWLCSLYSIFAIASILPTDNPQVADAMPSTYYLSIAKYLSIRACEIADVESLQAIVLLVCTWNDNIRILTYSYSEYCPSLDYAECPVLSHNRCGSANCVILRASPKCITQFTGPGG